MRLWQKIEDLYTRLWMWWLLREVRREIRQQFKRMQTPRAKAAARAMFKKDFTFTRKE